jgi:hypothetical protein
LNPSYDARSHQYAPWNVSPQPTIGIAWNPSYSGGLLGDLAGGGKTVVRAGFSIKRFTEPQQYFWNNATNHGIAYFQYFSLVPGTGPGTFNPGSLSLDQTSGIPKSAYTLSPPAYAADLPQTDWTWSYYWGGSGMDPNIQQPYLEDWNVGIQRELTPQNVLEVRYVGHRSLHQWISTDENEINIFENGFLNQFKAAQTNLAINQAHGISSFANNGYPGQQALPIFDTAFQGVGSANGYANSVFITDLTQGNAGGLAALLAVPPAGGTSAYLCNMVGSSLSPCANQGYSTPGPYPLNFWQANPYGQGSGIGTGSYLSAQGYGTYHSLQVEFRQKQWHGMQFDVNYTYSHTLGIQPDNQWLGTVNIFTIRDLRQSYGPTAFDIRHVLHGSGTYDLPFGSGRRFLNQKGVADKVVGGWSLGTILTIQSGLPFQLFGGYNTFNDYGDGG